MTQLRFIALTNIKGAKNNLEALTVATAPVYFFGIISFKINGHRTSWKIGKS